MERIGHTDSRQSAFHVAPAISAEHSDRCNGNTPTVRSETDSLFANGNCLACGDHELVSECSQCSGVQTQTKDHSRDGSVRVENLSNKHIPCKADTDDAGSSDCLNEKDNKSLDSASTSEPGDSPSSLVGAEYFPGGADILNTSGTSENSTGDQAVNSSFKSMFYRSYVFRLIRNISRPTRSSSTPPAGVERDRTMPADSTDANTCTTETRDDDWSDDEQTVSQRYVKVVEPASRALPRNISTDRFAPYIFFVACLKHYSRVMKH